MFQPGNKLGPGGLREGAGRPSTRELKEIAKAADRARAKLEAKFEKIATCYAKLATDYKHASTTQHAMENYVLPVSKVDKPVIVDRQTILAIIATPDALGYAEKITEAIAKRLHGTP